jgi:uncharacterized protein with HEPN domain
MSKRPAAFLIEDILECIENIRTYTDGLTFERFSQNQMIVDAVVRNLEILGEAAKRLPDDFRQKNPNVEWKKIVGLRNRIIHEYFGVDLDIIWRIISKDLPEFNSKLSVL